MKTLALSPKALDQPAVVLSSLGGSLLYYGKRPEGLLFLRGAQQRFPGDFWINFLLGLYWEQENPHNAIGYYRVAVAVRPTSGDAWTRLGRALRSIGDEDGAVGAFRRGIALYPNYDVARDLARALAPLGELESIRVPWGEYLDREPSDHSSWYGYAQLSLYLGNEEAYFKNRESLLRRFGDTSNPTVSERTSLACLLRPDSGDDFRCVIELVGCLVPETDPPEKVGRYLQFLKGLLLYREGRLEEAMTWLREASTSLPNRAGPAVVLAMAQHQFGKPIEARETFARVAAYNWHQAQATHATVWISHVLRREAETLILPNLQDFLQGTHHPGNNDERLSLLGMAQSAGRHLTAARLYQETFETDSQLADDLTADCLRRAFGDESMADRIEALNTAVRFLAARSAALAGTGQGTDVAGLDENERGRWRKQARDWLRSDLPFWTMVSRSDDPATRLLSRMMLLQWKSNPDLAGIRDPGSLDRLSVDERADCLSFWREVDTQLQDERN